MNKPWKDAKSKPKVSPSSDQLVYFLDDDEDEDPPGVWVDIGHWPAGS